MLSIQRYWVLQAGYAPHIPAATFQEADKLQTQALLATILHPSFSPPRSQQRGLLVGVEVLDLDAQQ
jgi:hypothetical protein